MSRTRVVVVADSALVRGLLAEIINRQRDMVCVGCAADLLVARALIRELEPDVVTLDVEMRRMDGLGFLARLMRLQPMPVVTVSTLTERGAELPLKALELGAIDFVAKPGIGIADGLQQLAEDIAERIRTAAQTTVRRSHAPACAHAPSLAQAPAPSHAAGRLSTEKIIFIGASTGSTEATRELLMQLPADAPAVMITQHMPPGFTRSCAARLDSLCHIRVAEAVDGERVLPGHAYLSPGGCHLAVERSGANDLARVVAGQPVNRPMPSVEVLFESAAHAVGPNPLGVMLTGMGADGAKAMRAMRDAGSDNLVQDEHSCVVFGMPREAIAHGAAHAVLPLQQIGPHLIERLRSAHGLATTRA